MNLFDIKIKRQEIFEDGSLYLEFQPKNNELEDFVMHAEQIFNFESISEVISELIPIVRDILFNSLPEEIQLNYVNTQYKINDSIDDPSLIDYDILGLHKKRTIVKGELILVEYFRDFDDIAQVYSDLVVKETRSYVRNQIGLALSRDMEITWYLKNGEIGVIKNTRKFYNSKESMTEGSTRRLNIIEEAKAYVLSVVGQANAFDLLSALKSYIELYKDGYRAPLISYVGTVDKPYLDANMKAEIIEILTF